MSFIFTPLTDEEINSFGLLENGIYDFEILKSTRRISKSGNPMAELHLRVKNDKGKEQNVFDYLVFSKIPLNIKKLKHFCETTGLEKDYQEGKLREDLEKLSGKLEIGVQDETANPNGGFYPRKNIVLDYIAGEPKDKKGVDDLFIDDDLPF